MPVLYVGNCWLPEYILSNCTPIISCTVTPGICSNIISDTLDTFGLTGIDLVHFTLGRPCHSDGAGKPLMVAASANNVIVQSPGDVLS